MGWWKTIKKTTLIRIRRYVSKVGGVTNSTHTDYFTPQNSAYWVFVGLFFLFFGVNHFFFGSVQEPEYFGALAQHSEISEKEPQKKGMVYRKLRELFVEMEDFQQLEQIKSFLPLHYNVLDSVPSAVPLFREHCVLSSPYGKRYHPVHQISKKHFGVDFAAAKDTPIYATAAGKVIRVEDSPKGYGLHIVISHAHGFETLYGHMESVTVMEGETIGAHDLIGTVGSTGLATGPHLHYEVIKNGLRIDPTASFNLKYEVYLNLKNPN